MLASPLPSGGRRRLGRKIVRRSGRRDGWSLFGLLGRLAVGFSQGRRRRVRGRLRDLGETFHGDGLPQNLASGAGRSRLSRANSNQITAPLTLGTYRSVPATPTPQRRAVVRGRNYCDPICFDTCTIFRSISAICAWSCFNAPHR